MVKLMLDRFGGDQRVRRRDAQEFRSPTTERAPIIECYHVNARFSDDIEDLGVVRWQKFFLVFRYCFEALWCRFRYGVRAFYFAPAPPRIPALVRDWLVMLICRPFFPIIVQHWHAAGLADWLEGQSTTMRMLTRGLLGKPALGIALGTVNLRDPLWLLAKRVEVVPNGIPDPFPDYKEDLSSRRQARLEARRLLTAGQEVPEQLLNRAGHDGKTFRLLYLGYCFREKGIFETLEGVAIALRVLSEAGAAIDLHLSVAGKFAAQDEEMAFTHRVMQPDLAGKVTFSGFVTGADKIRLLRESDCLCFPTYYDLESFGLVVLEAMAAGLQVITTRWRALPEILPPDHRGFVPLRDAEAIARIIPQMMTEDPLPLRTRFNAAFKDSVHGERLEEALLALRSGGSGSL